MSDEIVKKELYPSNSLKKKEKNVELPKKTIKKVEVKLSFERSYL